MKKVMKKLKEIGEMIIAIPIIILIGLALIIMVPLDYIKYKRSAYYKRERKKYSFFAASGTHFDLYNTIIKHDLPIEYIPDAECDELQCGWFVRGETLIVISDFPFEYDEDSGWNYCEYVEYEDGEDEHDDKKEIMSLDEYIDLQLSHVNESVTDRVFTDAVILIDEDSVEDNVKEAKAEPRFLVYSDSDPDNGMAEVLKRFCGVEETEKSEKRRKNENASQKEPKGFAKIFAGVLLIAAICAVFLGGVFLLDFVIENLLLPENYLFYEHTPIRSSLIAVLIIVPSLFLAAFLLYTIGRKLGMAVKDHLGIVRFIKFLGKWLIPIGTVWFIATYVCITGMTYVTSDSIVVTSPLDPKGQVYAYSDVEKIKCGFGDKKYSMYEYKKKGSFYYKITVGGEERVFHMPTPNPDVERYDDSYLEFEEFDSALTELDIPKESSSAGYEHCDFDQMYIDRFLRIIDNK